MADGRRNIAVVGGANVDIGGFPSAALVDGDSNPGRVRVSAGGVGRNIAENLARMGAAAHLVTALGDDANGRMLRGDCLEKGVDVSRSLVVSGGRTSVYLFVEDGRGDMRCAVNDMEIQARLTPEYLAPQMEWLNSMDAVVIDANLPESSIAYLAKNLRAPLFADAVSAAKAARLRGALAGLYCLKPNRIEAEILAGMPIGNLKDAETAARRLCDAGVQRVYLTLGAQGAVCAQAGACGLLAGEDSACVNATGAGDAFMAALAWGSCEGFDLWRCGAAGMAAAAIAVESADAVSAEMNRNHLIKRMADVVKRAQTGGNKR